MFLTCLIEHFNVDLSNEPVKNKVSTIKGGGIPQHDKGKNILLECATMTKQMVKSSKEVRKLALQNEKAWLKSHERVNLLLKHLDSVDEDMTPFEKEDDVLESNEENSDA
ncbi:hypothetical protein S245_034327 [Arachis hypogaea]